MRMPLARTRKRKTVSSADSSVTAIASFYSTIILHLPEFGLKGILSVCAPVFGYLTFIIWRLLRSNVNLAYHESKTKKYLAELNAEKRCPDLSCEDLKEIETQIRMYKSAIHQKRTEDLNMD